MTTFILNDFGSYITNGRRVTIEGAQSQTATLSAGLTVTHDPNGSFWIEQAYVQYLVPQQRSLPWPIVLVHGGGMTGSCWETTPDYRPGWIQHFVSAGFETHVMDNVERGRAGFCALDGYWEGSPIMRSMEDAWTLFRIGNNTSFAQRKAYPGQQFPVEHFDTMAKSMVPRWLSTTSAQRTAIVDVIDRLGPCILLGHSQGGGLCMEAASLRPEAVKAVIAIEPHGDFEVLQNRPTRGCDLLLVLGDYLGTDHVWQNLTARAQKALAQWQDNGGNTDQLYLNEEGLPGHSHLMMMDQGNEIIAERLINWIKERYNAGSNDFR